MAKGWFGKGSTTSVTYIEDIEDLNAVRLLPKDGVYDLRLSNDINMNVYPYNQKEGWEPLPIFHGVFNGQKHTIFNLYINRPKEDNVGLFRRAYNTDTYTNIIREVFFDNIDITGKNNVGTLIGLADNTYGLSINQIIVSGKINGNNKVAGLIGFSQAKTSSYIDDIFINISFESNKGSVDALVTGGYNLNLRDSVCLAKFKLYEDNQIETNSYNIASVWYNTDYIKSVSYKGSKPSGQTTSNFCSGLLTLPCSDLKNYINVYRGKMPEYNKYWNIRYVIKIEDSYCIWDYNNNVWIKVYGEDISELDIVKKGYDKSGLERIPKAASRQLKGKNVSLISVIPQLNGFKTINVSNLITFDEDYNAENQQENKYVLKKTFSYADFNNEICSLSTL